MAEGSNGGTDIGDTEESDPLSKGTLSKQEASQVFSSSESEDNDDTTKSAAPPHHLTTALSIEKSQTIDHYSVVFITKEVHDHLYFCVICGNLMLDPLAIRRCIHNICTPCFLTQSQKKTVPKNECSPGDRGPNTHVGLTSNDVSPDAHLKTEIHRKQMHCPNKNYHGCPEVLYVSQIKEHLLETCLIPPGTDDVTGHILSSIPDSTNFGKEMQRKGDSSKNMLPLVEVLKTLSLKVQVVKDKNVSLKEDLKKVDLTNANLKEHVTTFKDTKQHLERENIKFKAKLGKNDDEISRLRQRSTHIRGTIQPRDPQRIHNLLNQVVIMNTTINELDLRLQFQENVSYDGELMWKISNFSEHLDRVDRTDILVSQPFYDNMRGYKMCCKLYLKGKRTRRDAIEDDVAAYMSLYFVLMKGTYDELLQWPFRKTITLTLKNFEQNIPDISRQIVPDNVPAIDNPENKCFKQPVTDMNKPVGIQRFLRRTDYNNYIRNDSLYIVCRVRSW